MFQILERRNFVAVLVLPGLVPARADGHEEGLGVGREVFGNSLEEVGLVLEMSVIVVLQMLALAVEFVLQALQEQHAEDEFLELGGIHLTAEDVSGLEEE